MKALISFDDELPITARDLAGAWNTHRSTDGVAEVRRPTDTFSADWMLYLGAAASAATLLQWIGLPSLKEAIRSLFPKRAEKIDEWTFEVNVSGEMIYVRVRKTTKG